MAPFRKNSARSRNATTSPADAFNEKRTDSNLSTDSSCSERVLVYNVRRNQIFSMPRDELGARTSGREQPEEIDLKQSTPGRLPIYLKDFSNEKQAGQDHFVGAVNMKWIWAFQKAFLGKYQKLYIVRSI